MCILSHSVTLCNFMDCSPPGFSVHGILQARILEWLAISCSRGSSQPRDQSCISALAGRHIFFFFYHCATWESPPQRWACCKIKPWVSWGWGGRHISSETVRECGSSCNFSMNYVNQKFFLLLSLAVPFPSLGTEPSPNLIMIRVMSHILVVFQGAHVC